MRHASLVRLVLCLALGGLDACESDDGSGPFGNLGRDVDENGQDSVAPGEDTRGGAPDFPAATGNSTADRMLAAAQACGYQSPSTVPVGWGSVIVGEGGCSAWAPSGWVSTGAGTSVTLITETQSGDCGFMALTGVPYTTIACTPAGARDYIVAGLEQGGCQGVSTLHWAEGTDQFAGYSFPRGDFFFTCQSNGVTRAAYLWISIQGTEPLCNLLVLGLWTEASAIEAKMCTVTQVFNSIKCPSGGGGSCSDSECDSACRGEGYGGGSCVDDECQCQ